MSDITLNNETIVIEAENITSTGNHKFEDDVKVRGHANISGEVTGYSYKIGSASHALNTEALDAVIIEISTGFVTFSRNLLEPNTASSVVRTAALSPAPLSIGSRLGEHVDPDVLADIREAIDELVVDLPNSSPPALRIGAGFSEVRVTDLYIQKDGNTDGKDIGSLVAKLEKIEERLNLLENTST